MVTTWNSWNTIDALQRDIDRAFANVGHPGEPFFQTAVFPGRATQCYPLINLYEDRGPPLR
jgi:hypothetical protein